MSFKCPRCSCGLYTSTYALRLGHVCSETPQEPAKKGGPRNDDCRFAVVGLRADGLKLRQIGELLGVSKERVRQWINSADVFICRKCKKPVPELVPGRRVCRDCHAQAMLNRPSKRRKATGYRTDSGAHRRAAAVRMAREGKTLREIATSIGYTYNYVWRVLKARQIDVKRQARAVKP